MQLYFFGADRMSAGELADTLKRSHGIVVKTKPHHSPEFPDGNADWVNSIRLSMHVFNTAADVQATGTLACCEI